NPHVKPIGGKRMPATFSYFIGPRSAWKTGVPAYAGVTYPNLWPGIDLIYTGESGVLKYEFLVRPGAKPEQIRMAWRGAGGMRVNADGQLIVSTPVRELRDDRPIAYQTIGGKRVEAGAAYALGSGEEYGFHLEAYDRSQALVIDPSLIYAG